MAMIRWNDPFRDFGILQDRINRVFADSYGRPDEGLVAAGTWLPPVDIFQSSEHELVVKAELPDMKREDIDVTVENGTLTLRGEKKFAHDVKEEHYHRVERRYGAFTRSFALPTKVDAAKVSADYRDGVLTVRLPLREEAKPRQIKVDVAA